MCAAYLAFGLRLHRPSPLHQPTVIFALLLLTQEQLENYVLFPFRGRGIMVRAVAEEALALASISLFLAMVAVWAQVLGVV